MEARPSLSRATNLRQSYIEISRYFRGWRSDATPTRSTWTSPVCARRRHNTASETRSSAYKLPHVFKRQVDIFNHCRIDASASATSWEHLRRIDIESLPATSSSDSQQATQIQLYGYITSQRATKDSIFVQFVDPRLELAVQAVFPKTKPNTTLPANEASEDFITDSDHAEDSTIATDTGLAGQLASGAFRSSPHGSPGHTAGLLLGRLVRRSPPLQKEGDRQGTAEGRETAHQSAPMTPTRILDSYVGPVELLSYVEIQGESWKALNVVDFRFTKIRYDTVFGPELRHLQFRTDPELRRRIRLRSRVAGKIRDHMLSNEFDEIETPLLFKSTPEGAREFIVPTRKKGMAYALPQSPQQYKQVLMASGISRYFQFARCFRDEDLRADRQPEFTQLDLEMAFANDFDVMSAVEDLLINAVWPSVPEIAPLQASIRSDAAGRESSHPEHKKLAFPQMTYEAAMSRYGSDKPDTRLGSEIRRVDHWLPSDVKEKITTLEDPVVEMFKLDMHGCEPAESQKFFQSFLEASHTARYATDEARMPGVAVFDPLKPLHGLFHFGHEGCARLEADFEPEPGDIFVFWSRENKPFTGGSTILGDLRRDIFQNAISQGLIPAPVGYSPLWITDFPLFSPTEESEPGQGGSAGICSTHHPFTAPKQSQAADYLQILNDPLSVLGDHYDLVINGVEVGGGSVRIHKRGMQEFILREVLKLDPDRAKNFDHLLRALESGCPPHAGFALGFDRLMVMLTNSTSVRDVIAFPKYADGEDKFAGSPSRLTPEQLATYHLAVTEKAIEIGPPKISKKA